MKRFFLALIFVMLTASVARAQLVGPPGPFQGFKSNDKQPVEIHADRMEADLSTGKLRFIGHVSAKQGTRVIYAERIDVRYTEQGSITDLEANGAVKVKMGEAFATSDRLVLDNRKQVIKLLGRPRVVQGKQVMIGETITYEIKTEKLVVTKPRIEWLPGEGENPDDGAGKGAGAPRPGQENQAGKE